MYCFQVLEVDVHVHISPVTPDVNGAILNLPKQCKALPELILAHSATYSSHIHYPAFFLQSKNYHRERFIHITTFCAGSFYHASTYNGFLLGHHVSVFSAPTMVFPLPASSPEKVVLKRNVDNNAD